MKVEKETSFENGLIRYFNNYESLLRTKLIYFGSIFYFNFMLLRNNLSDQSCIDEQLLK